MEIRKGYKQSEVGIIPEDWDISTIGQQFEIQLGKMLDAEKNTGIHKPYLGNKSVQWSKIDVTDLPTMAMSVTDLVRYRLRRGDLLVCEGGEVGRSAIWDEPIQECYYQKALHRLRPLSGFNTYLIIAFLYHWTSNGLLANYVSQSSIAHLTSEKLAIIPLPVPKQHEQHAIGAALSDVDALLNSLDALIAKKRLIKQGAMQELLTGKRRLPEFNKTWDKKSLENICNIEKGEQLNRDTLSLSDDYPAWNGGIEPSGFTNKWNTEENTITVSEGGNSCGFVNFVKQKFWRGGHCYALKNIDRGVSKEYLYQFLKHNEAVIMALRVGSGLPNIQRARLSSFVVFLPSLPEQTAIAEILSDMDAEISALEQKREKTRQLKQGMMQELLTGRIRLVQP